MNLQQAMQQATEKLGGDPIIINKGECGDWAELVQQLCPSAQMTTFQYKKDDGSHECYHAYIVQDDKCYDSETPHGVLSPEDFPIIGRDDNRATMSIFFEYDEFEKIKECIEHISTQFEHWNIQPIFTTEDIEECGIKLVLENYSVYPSNHGHQVFDIASAFIEGYQLANRQKTS